MRKLILLAIIIPFASFGQINVVENKPKEIIGKIAPLGDVLIECSKTGNTYSFIYRDIKFTSLTDYESFSFRDIDNAFESLYSLIIKGLKEKRTDTVTIELPEGEGVIFLNFIKSFGVASLQIAHAPYKEHNIIKYSTYLSKNKVKKLFGKI